MCKWIGNTYVLILPSIFNLSWHAALAEGHEDTPGLPKYVIGIGQTILISSSDNCGHFSLLQLNCPGDLKV